MDKTDPEGFRNQDSNQPGLTGGATRTRRLTGSPNIGHAQASRGILAAGVLGVDVVSFDQHLHPTLLPEDS